MRSRSAARAASSSRPTSRRGAIDEPSRPARDGALAQRALVGAGIVAALLARARRARALTVVDDAGQRFVLERPPQRVVTLAPSLTELVFAAGGGASLVGTSALSDYPPAARAIPRIGDAGRLDVERVIALRPDLVLIWQRGNTSRELEQLEAAGIRLFQLEPRRLDDVARAIERLGALLGHEAEANRRAGEMRAALAAAARRPRRRGAGQRVLSGVATAAHDDQRQADHRRHPRPSAAAATSSPSLTPLVPIISTEAVVGADPEAILTASETVEPGALATRSRQRRASPPGIATPA